MSAREILGCVILLLGGVFLVISALGLHVLPDALSRQHAGTKATTFSLLVVCLGASLIHGGQAFIVRLILLMVFLFVTLPLGSHVIGKAAQTELFPEDEG